VSSSITKNMGIKSFSKVIKRFAPEAEYEINPQTLRGSVIGVDLSMSLYQVSLGMKTTLTHNEQDITYLYGLYNRFTMFKKLGIHLVVVADGKPPKIKEDTLLQRDKKKQLSAQHTLGTTTRSFKIEAHHLDGTKKLCLQLGIPFLYAEGEADLLLAKLYRDKVISHILSCDSDIIVMGGSRIIKKASTSKFVIWDGTILLQKLQNLNPSITEDSLIDLACLLGNDYNTNPKGIGPVTAVKLIVKYNDLETILTNTKNTDLLDSLSTTQKYYLTPSLQSYSGIMFKVSETLLEYLEQVLNLGEKKLINNIWEKSPTEWIDPKNKQFHTTDDKWVERLTLSAKGSAHTIKDLIRLQNINHYTTWYLGKEMDFAHIDKDYIYDNSDCVI